MIGRKKKEARWKMAGGLAQSSRLSACSHVQEYRSAGAPRRRTAAQSKCDGGEVGGDELALADIDIDS